MGEEEILIKQLSTEDWFNGLTNADKILTVATFVTKKFPRLRLGQSVFNTAYAMFPKETNKIRGTDDDCFYNDSIIGNFLNHFKV